MLEYDADDPPQVEEWSDWWRATAEYRTVFRLTWPTQIFWLIIYCIAFLFIAPKVFGEEAGVSEGLICDTLPQVESYLAVLESGKTPDESILLVNTTAQTTVCAKLFVAYIKGDDIARVQVEGGSMHIFSLTVLGYWHGKWIPLEPMLQYAPFFIHEKEA